MHTYIRTLYIYLINIVFFAFLLHCSHSASQHATHTHVQTHRHLDMCVLMYALSLYLALPHLLALHRHAYSHTNARGSSVFVCCAISNLNLQQHKLSITSRAQANRVATHTKTKKYSINSFACIFN